MISKPEKNTILTGFLLDYSENRLTIPELNAFNDLMEVSADLKREAESGKGVTAMLKTLPRVKASEHFDRRMAARFAMELEREVTEKNIRSIENNNVQTV